MDLTTYSFDKKFGFIKFNLSEILFFFIINVIEFCIGNNYRFCFNLLMHSFNNIISAVPVKHF